MPHPADQVFAHLTKDLKDICDNAFAYATRYMPEYHPFMANDSEQIQFYRNCAQGQKLAQQKLIQKFALIDEYRRQFSDVRHAPSHQVARNAMSTVLHAIDYCEALYRTIANAVAWTLLGGNDWQMRRFYTGHPPTPFRAVNWKATVHFLQNYHSSPDRFGLITDLTSCIQTGDLILVDHSISPGHHLIAELKEGTRSRRMIDTLQYERRIGVRIIAPFESATAKDLQHFSRIRRQSEVFDQVRHVLAQDRGTDPESQRPIRIIESDIRVSRYDEELDGLIDVACRDGFSIQRVLPCLWICAFESNATTNARGEFLQEIQRHALVGVPTDLRRPKTAKGVAPWGIANFTDSVFLPPTEPLFRRRLSAENLLDIVNKRVTVLIYLDVDRLLDAMRDGGVRIRWQTRREASANPADGYFSRFGRNLVVERNRGDAIVVGDRMIVRLIYECWSLDSTIAWYRTLQEATAW